MRPGRQGQARRVLEGSDPQVRLLQVAGLPVPGIYGPAREEWGQFGMPAQE